MSYRDLLLTGLGVLLIGVCGAAALPLSQSADKTFEMVKTERFEGVIISREKGKSFAASDKFWTPSKRDVLKLEEKIGEYLKKAASPASPDLWSKLPAYKRQYVGIVKNERKIIFTNFFCDSITSRLRDTMGIDWKSRPLGIEDGGDCFFNVWYDVDSETFSNLQISGIG